MIFCLLQSVLEGCIRVESSYTSLAAGEERQTRFETFPWFVLRLTRSGVQADTITPLTGVKQSILIPSP